MEDLISLVIWIGILVVIGGRFRKKITGASSNPGAAQNVKGAAVQKGYGSNVPVSVSTNRGAMTVQPHRQSSAMESSRREASSMPHKHRESGVYDTFNRKSWRNDSGSMPHKHEKSHYTAMMDVSKLPPGYILLNGEPVRVADLEGK